MGALSGSRVDVLVVGGGPAGLAAAIAARLKGFDVALADSSLPPIDKACGEGLLPSGVEAMRRLGIDPWEAGLPFQGIRFFSGERCVEAVFHGACGIAMRRTRLHAALVRRASELGIRLHWGTPVRGMSNLPPCGWIIGADGQNSMVRREAQLDGVHSFHARFGFRRHYRLRPWTNRVEVYWGARSQVFVTPVDTDEVGVAVLSRDPQLRLDAALLEFPALLRRLHGAVYSSNERGAIVASRRLQRIFRGRTALVGDASGSVDAITGDGLSLAFCQALALADALAAGDLRLYQAEHRRLARGPERMAKALLLLGRLPPLARVAFQALAWEPSILRRLLSLHAA